MYNVNIYTDGSYRKKLKRGGYSIIMQCGPYKQIIYGDNYNDNVTIDRMELYAAIRALEVLTETCNVILYIDRQNIVNGINDWIYKWKECGWINASGNTVANVDLWKRMNELMCVHNIRAVWVRGHDGHQENELADYFCSTL